MKHSSRYRGSTTSLLHLSDQLFPILFVTNSRFFGHLAKVFRQPRRQPPVHFVVRPGDRFHLLGVLSSVCECFVYRCQWDFGIFRDGFRAHPHLVFAEDRVDAQASTHYGHVAMLVWSEVLERGSILRARKGLAGLGRGF